MQPVVERPYGGRALATAGRAQACRQRCAKEIRRGNQYHGIILDPPAYGHGANGEKWKLEENIQEMMESVLHLLNPKEHLLILNAYSLGFSALVAENMLSDFSKKNKSELTIGELYIPAKTGIKLPLGVWGKLVKK